MAHAPDRARLARRDRGLPTARIAAELPELISDVLASAAGEGGGRPATSCPTTGAAGRAGSPSCARRESLTAAELARDVAALQAVIARGAARGRRRARARGVRRARRAARRGRRRGPGGGGRGRWCAPLARARVAANTDPLTGLHNLRYLQRAARATCSALQQALRPAVRPAGDRRGRAQARQRRARPRRPATAC